MVCAPSSDPDSTVRTSVPSLHDLEPAAEVREVDAERARVGLLVAAVLAASSALLLQTTSTRSTLHWVVTVVIGFTAVACGTAAVRAARGAVGRNVIYALGVLMSITTLLGISYVGIVSAAVVMLCVVVFAYGLGNYHPGRLLIFLTCAGGYLALCALTLVGWLPTDQAPIGMRHDHPALLVGFAVMLELVLGLTFWMARRSRVATERALERAQSAHRELSRQEALLAEAHADLDQEAGAAREGRMTGRRVGRYRAGELIGRGAMGEIYFAWDSDRAHPAALKILHESLRDNSELVDRFFREVSALRELRSPHVVEVLASGLTEDGRPFLAMELLRGRDLSRHLRARSKLDLEETIQLVSQVAFGLQAAHDAGIVHRDIKPKNIFAVETADGILWKVLDFGVSKMMHRSGTLTRQGVIGTPNYMSPEQARAESVDHRADVFALGAIAYRALTGRPAFGGPEACAMMYQVVHSQPQRPGALADLPEEVELTLALALAKDKSQRLSSATRFALALHSAARGCLPHALREAGEQLLQREPWGSQVHPIHAHTTLQTPAPQTAAAALQTPARQAALLPPPSPPPSRPSLRDLRATAPLGSDAGWEEAVASDTGSLAASVPHRAKAPPRSSPRPSDGRNAQDADDSPSAA
jgi:serine/threonine-protein kinase